MYACLYLKEEFVAELVRLGANVNLIDKDGETVLFYVANFFNIEMEKMEKIEWIAKMLIKAGCDPMMRNNKNKTFVDILKRNHNNELATKLEEWM